MLALAGVGQPTYPSLKLETAARTLIPNAQLPGPPPADIPKIRGEHVRKWGNNRTANYALGARIVEDTPTFRYNCFGLVFGDRRTCIDDPSVIVTILKDDGYDEVLPAQVLPGDIIVYYLRRENDDVLIPNHAGIVVSGVPNGAVYPVPLIRSKWGAGFELIHMANCGPYDFGLSKYFRISRY